MDLGGLLIRDHSGRSQLAIAQTTTRTSASTTGPAVTDRNSFLAASIRSAKGKKPMASAPPSIVSTTISRIPAANSVPAGTPTVISPPNPFERGRRLVAHSYCGARLFVL